MPPPAMWQAGGFGPPHYSQTPLPASGALSTGDSDVADDDEDDDKDDALILASFSFLESSRSCA